MENFRFENKTEILFGRDTHLQVGDYVARFADKVLILYGSDRIEKNGLLEQVVSSLKNKGIAYDFFSGIQANPKLTKIQEGSLLCKKKNIDFLLAIGGGSVIDTAKAIALANSYDGEVWDFFSGTQTVLSELNTKIGVILTIPGSGSEVSASTVITNDLEAVHQKRDFSSKLLRPCFAILNPDLSMSLSWGQSACGAIDMFSHVMERYFTRVKHVELTDGLCEATMRTIVSNILCLEDDMLNYDIRAELMWASAIAHSNILSTGRRSDWASHMMEHEVSARYDIPHGDGLAMIIPYWMEYVFEKHLSRFAQYARKVWDINDVGKSEYEIALLGIEKTKNFFLQLGKEVSLKSFKLTEDLIRDMALSITKKGTVGDLEFLSFEDVQQILMKASLRKLPI